MSDEIKPLFKNEILNSFRYGDDNWRQLYPIFAALRGPDFDFESSLALKLAFTLRVRAALSKEIRDVEERIREDNIMELAFVQLYKDLMLNREAREQSAAFQHYFSHLDDAFFSLSLLAEDEALREHYSALSSVCGDIYRFATRGEVSSFFAAVREALERGLATPEGFKAVLAQEKRSFASYFAALMRQYLGINIEIENSGGEQ